MYTSTLNIHRKISHISNFKLFYTNIFNELLNLASFIRQ